MNPIRSPQSRRRHKSSSDGFTLIELMIVVAIIGILAAVAIPLYFVFSIRAQVSEGVSLASSAKAAATVYYQQQGTLAGDNMTVGLAPPATITGDFVTQISIVPSGGIQISYGNKTHPDILGGVLTMSPITSAGSITWTCSGDATLVPRYLPGSCR